MSKCRDCKKEFSVIDANQRCINCWEKFNFRLRMGKWEYRLFVIECALYSICHSIAERFRFKRYYYCICIEKQNLREDKQ